MFTKTQQGCTYIVNKKEKKVIFKLTELFIDILKCKIKLEDGNCLKRVKKNN